MSEYIYGTDDHEGHWLTGERIVRCRNCYFAEEFEGGYWCDRFGQERVHVTPKGFCAWGEPREAPDPSCDECGMKCIEKYRVDCPKAERREARHG